jgi:hypothetical protein
MAIQTRDVPDEPPPFLGTRGTVYDAVIAYLVLIIISFYVFTRAFS